MRWPPCPLLLDGLEQLAGAALWPLADADLETLAAALDGVRRLADGQSVRLLGEVESRGLPGQDGTGIVRRVAAHGRPLDAPGRGGRAGQAGPHPLPLHPVPRPRTHPRRRWRPAPCGCARPAWSPRWSSSSPHPACPPTGPTRSTPTTSPPPRPCCSTTPPTYRPPTWPSAPPRSATTSTPAPTTAWPATRKPNTASAASPCPARSQGCTSSTARSPESAATPCAPRSTPGPPPNPPPTPPPTPAHPPNAATTPCTGSPTPPWPAATSPPATAPPPSSSSASPPTPSPPPCPKTSAPGRPGSPKPTRPAPSRARRRHPPLPPRLLARLACGADLVPVLIDDLGDPLDVGRTHRYHTPRQRTALIERDRHCTWDACTAPASWCDAHHLTPWDAGGHTTVHDGALLCDRHHHHVHATGATGRVVNGQVIWTPRDHPPGDELPLPPPDPQRWRRHYLQRLTRQWLIPRRE